LVMMIVIPIFYGILGFIGGLISGLIYNAAAGFMGGIELEIEGDTAGFLNPPSPPQNWGNQQQPQYKYQ
jgi:hypothetical protein